MARDQERDGRYLLVTNRALSAEEMLVRFKEQDKIEKRNRTFKGPIRIRPMFLHKQERIESLIFICLLALLVFSILEMLAKQACIVITARKRAVALPRLERILKQFQTLTGVYTLFKDGSCWKQVVPLSPFQQEFLAALDFPAPEIYLKQVKLE